MSASLVRQCGGAHWLARQVQLHLWEEQVRREKTSTAEPERPDFATEKISSGCRRRLKPNICAKYVPKRAPQSEDVLYLHSGPWLVTVDTYLSCSCDILFGRTGLSSWFCKSDPSSSEGKRGNGGYLGAACVRETGFVGFSCFFGLYSKLGPVLPVTGRGIGLHLRGEALNAANFWLVNKLCCTSANEKAGKIIAGLGVGFSVFPSSFQWSHLITK